MIYTFKQLLRLFIIYSFLGWIGETLWHAAKQKRFVNPGAVNLPFCTLYGFSAVFTTVFCYELSGLWLFTGAVIISTLFEWVSGHIIEKIYHRKWWDYSKVKFNLDGYICLPMSLLWGALSYLCIKYINEIILTVIGIFPQFISSAVLAAITALLITDVAATAFAISGNSKNSKKWEEIDNRFIKKTLVFQEKIYSVVNGRINKAYPESTSEKSAEDKDGVLSFYNIVMIFIIGAFAGDIVETIFCRVTAGVWMSRSSVVWGPFSIVWGGAFAAAVILLHRYRNSSPLLLFAVGTVLGGAYEYLCSVFTEIFFGTVFWDYSHMKYNLGGRINLLYCFFWGIAAVVWMKFVYPYLTDIIEKVPQNARKIATWALFSFMCVNILVSGMALTRYNERQNNVPAQKSWQQTMDENFDDKRMKKIYPNMISVTD